MSIPMSDDLGVIPRPTPAERANLRANLRCLARDEQDAGLLIDMLEDDRG